VKLKSGLRFVAALFLPSTASRSRLGLAGVTEQFGTIERRSPALDRLVPSCARIERIAAGFGFTEGPVWMPGGYLLFGDLPNNVIRRWDPVTRSVSVVRTRSGYAAADRPPGFSMGSNGMTLDRDGRLTVCEPGNRRVTRTEPDGAMTVLADRYQGRRLNSPNDLVYRRSDGSLYFTDPPHGLLKEDADPDKELPFNGVYRWSDGALQLVVRDLTRPNGIAFSPDERFLYLSNSDPARKIWMRYEVNGDGSLADGNVLLDLDGEPGQAPDGLKVDVEGNLYLTGPSGLWIVSPAGEVLGVIRTQQEPSNVAWGEDDRRTLYLTAPNEIYRIRLEIPGIPLFARHAAGPKPVSPSKRVPGVR
jgi:gluconolactonase